MREIFTHLVIVDADLLKLIKAKADHDGKTKKPNHRVR
jgi:hypothetical protein